MALAFRLLESGESRAGKPPELQRYHVSNQGLLAVTLSEVRGLHGVGETPRSAQNDKSRKAGRGDS